MRVLCRCRSRNTLPAVPRRLLIQGTPTFLVERLEDRRLLSATLDTTAAMLAASLPASWEATPMIDPLYTASPDTGSGSPSGLSPNQVRGAYGLGSYTAGILSNGISFGGVQGDGRGQTIAIVDTYDDPNAASDLNAFSSYYGLPTFGGTGAPTFAKLNQTGGTTLPGTDPSGKDPATGSWEEEESLDIEWAHTMAPMANIILFEASDPNTGLYTAVQTAANTPGVVDISMSWSGYEFSGETSTDSIFTTPAGHVGGAATIGGAGITGGVTFLAAAGDSGAYAPGTNTITPFYPAASPNVVAVGGTDLTVAGSDPNYTYGGETGWGSGTTSGTGSGGGGGGGISKYEAQPAYQNGVVGNYSTTQRTYPDVSTDADPSSGVPIYDSWDFGSSKPWLDTEIGGTSLACPLWAGVIAVADEGRAIAGKGSLDGPSQTLPAIYKLPAADFHDITSGSNGPSPLYVAGPGYDLVTGVGSPVSNLLVPALAGLTQTATTTTVTTSNPAAIYGQNVTFTATITPASGSGETGTVQFQIDGSNAGSPVTLSGGAAGYTTTTLLSAGNHTIVAIYSGDYYFAGSTSPAFTQAVATATISVMPPANQLAVAGQSYSFALGNLAVNGNAVAPFSVDVNWGDGSADTHITGLTAAGVIPAQSHTYTAVGSDTVTLTATDSASHTSYSVTFSIGVYTSSPIVVNTFVDQTDPTGCATVSLRDAIAAAAANPGPDIILLPAGNYALTLGELKISDASGNLTIQTIGGNATIQGDGSTRVLEIDAPSNVAITDVEITGGYMSSDSSTPQQGAGIYNSGTLALTNVTVDSNSITQTGGPAAGAGIENSGNLTVLDSIITSNTASGAISETSWSGSVTGGGIDNSGNLTIADSTISGNSLSASSLGYLALLSGYLPNGEVNAYGAGLNNSGTATLTAVTVDSNTIGTSYGGNARGGGIENTGTLTVVSSTISNNQASATAGGYLSYAGNCSGGGVDNAGTATIVDSTVSGDSAAGIGETEAYGGGIFNRGELTLCDSTVSGDSATTTTEKYAGYLSSLFGSYYYTGAAAGGGVGSSAGSATVANTSISGNTDLAISSYPSENGSATAPNASGTFVSQGHNLIGQTDGSSGWITADLTGTTASPLNADLGPLASNGGPTLTMLPLAGSPAIDAGSNALIPTGITTDQRGWARIYNGTVDIGAVEVQPTTTSITLTAPGNQTATIGLSQSFSLGSFTQFNATAPYSVTVNWGDGSANTVIGNLTAAGSIPSVTHTYTSVGNDTVSETVTDAGNHTSNAATFGVTVAAPVVSITVTPPGNQTVNVAQSQSFSLGSFAESNATGPYSLTVNWGDGSANTVLGNLSVGAIPAAAHTYTSIGNDTVRETVTDAGNHASNTATFGVNVLGPAVITVTPPANQSALTWQSTSISLGSFTQANATAPFTVTVNWGDGSPLSTIPVSAAGTIPAATHTYYAVGNDTVTETVADSASHSSNSATFTVNIVAVTLTLMPPAGQIAAAGLSQAFSLGNFTQSNATAPYSVSVNWGDGSPLSTFSTSAAGAIPAAAHTYAGAGNDTVTETVTDAGSHTSNSATFVVSVAPVWFGPGTAATWNAGNQTLTVTGNVTISSDPGKFGVAPIIADSSTGNLTIDTLVADGGDGDATVHLGQITGNGATTNNANNSLVVGNFSQSALVNNGAVAINGTGAIGQLTGNGSLLVGNGSSSNTVQLTAQTTPDSVTNTQASLLIGVGSTLDITNNILLLNYGNGSTPLAMVQTAVGYGAGAGSVSGAAGAILSSTAINGVNGQFSVGFADSTELGSIPAGNVKLMYTLAGDAELKGLVDFRDYSILQNSYNQTGRDWWQGDYTHDETVNFMDYSMMQNNYNQTMAGVVTGAVTLNRAAAGTMSGSSPAAAVMLPWTSAPSQGATDAASDGWTVEGIMGWLL